MDTPAHRRLLTIGEFSAATRLSPKALRLYDEQGLMRPALVDPNNGYRYYNRDQVAAGRLIRTLREMNLSLNEIARVMQGGPRAEQALTQLAQEIERRYAREKHAFQAALLLLRNPSRREIPDIHEEARTAGSFIVRTFRAEALQIVPRFLAERESLALEAERAGLSSLGPAVCALLEQSDDEETSLEALLPVSAEARPSVALTVRHIPARRYASVSFLGRSVNATEIAARSDALFDWFDRCGHRALDVPWLRLPAQAESEPLLMWAFDSESAR